MIKASKWMKLEDVSQRKTKSPNLRGGSRGRLAGYRRARDDRKDGENHGPAEYSKRARREERIQGTTKMKWVDCEGSLERGGNQCRSRHASFIFDVQEDPESELIAGFRVIRTVLG